MTIRITLDEADFRALVAGGTVRREGYGGWIETVEIALSDLGWAAMRSAIHDASRSAPDEPG